MTRKYVDMDESAHVMIESPEDHGVIHTSGLAGCLSVAAFFESIEGRKAVFLSHYPPANNADEAERNIAQHIDALRDMGMVASVGAVIVPERWVEEDGRWILSPIDSAEADVDGYKRALGIDAVRTGYKMMDPRTVGSEKDREWGYGTARIGYNPEDKYSVLRVHAQGKPVNLK